MLPRYSVNQYLNHPSAPPPLLYEIPEILSTIDHATLCYQYDTIMFLQLAEWRTTLTQYPTHIPTNPLTAPITDWHTYTPNLTHQPGTTPPPPKEYMDRFRQQACLRFMSHATSHPLTSSALHISDNDIMLILKNTAPPLSSQWTGRSDHHQSHTSIHRISPTTQPRPILRPVSPLLQSTTPLHPETGCIYPSSQLSHESNPYQRLTAQTTSPTTQRNFWHVSSHVN